MSKSDVYFVINPDGSSEEIVEQRPLGSQGFWSMVKKEALGLDYQPLDSEPAYLSICKKLGIAWEEMSDSGHMRYGPKGALVFDLLCDYINMVVRDLTLPLFQIKGTNMFNLSEGPVAEHAQLFGDRLYSLRDPDSKRAFVLRYAACHQQFSMIKHWQISHRHLPFGAYELADSYRLEQSGECMLGFRTRRLNMPDLHVFCQGKDDGSEWFMRLHSRIMEEIKQFGQDYELLVNLSSQEAFDSNRELLVSLAQDLGKPVLIHLYPGDRNYYWTVNAEYHIIDVLGRAREIGTVQIDVGNAARFGITYVDSEGQKQQPVILHTAIIGTIERFLYMVMDKAVSQVQAGMPGVLPYWLSPEQVRLLPVAAEHLLGARQLMSSLENAGIRVGLDDRPEKVSRKVRDAQVDWVPYYIVVGARELKGEELALVERSEGLEHHLSRINLN